MTDMSFDPGKNLGDEIINMDRARLCELVSGICRRIKAETGTRNYRGGIYPENISINEAGELQLGLARSENWEGQELEFLAPELYWDGRRSQASDVYSLGMLLYYAVNKGKLPYEGRCDNPQLKRMNGEEFPMPKAAGRRLGEIIRKATAFRPEDRYSNVEELQIMLDNCMNNRYVDGSDGARAIFKKEDGQLSDMEKLMVGIIEKGEDDLPPQEPEESPDKPAAEESPGETEQGEQESPQEPEKDSSQASAAEEAGPAPEAKAGEESGEDKEELKVYEPVKKPKPKKPQRPPQKKEGVPILTEEKNPELEPVILRNRSVQPAVQYGRSAEREKNIAEQMRKRKNRRLVSVLVICAVIVVTAIIVNALLDDMSWKKDEEPDNALEIQEDLPLIAPGDNNQIGLMPAQSPRPEESPEPSPSPEPPKEHRYELIMEDVSWTEAAKKCLEMGGYLVVINDQAELDRVIGMAEASGLQRIWIGGHRINDTIVWESGEEVSFFPAAWGQPGGEPSYEDTDGTPEDYLMLMDNGGWMYNDNRNDPAADYPQFYSGTIGYICEFED